MYAPSINIQTLHNSFQTSSCAQYLFKAGGHHSSDDSGDASGPENDPSPVDVKQTDDVAMTQDSTSLIDDEFQMMEVIVTTFDEAVPATSSHTAVEPARIQLCDRSGRGGAGGGHLPRQRRRNDTR